MENNSIFEGVQFADVFTIRDGRRAVVTEVTDYMVALFIERGEHQIWGEVTYPINSNGKFDDSDRFKNLDIVSRYKEKEYEN